MKGFGLFFFTLTAVIGSAAEILPPPPVPRPDQTGVLRIWGSAEATPVVRQWQNALKRIAPRLRLESRFAGSDVAMGALATSATDVAVLGRDATPAELKAFEWVFRYPPRRIEVATGSLSSPGASPALVLYVHRDNPLRRLTLAQVDAIFGRELRRGAPRVIETWGELGLAGDWSEQAISLYAPDTESGTGRFFREVALVGSRQLAWSRLTEFADTRPEAQPNHDASAKILAALAQDPRGLAVAGGEIALEEVRRVELATSEDGSAIELSAENLVNRKYPFARSLVAYVNCKPDTPLDPQLLHLFGFVLSEAGQRELATVGTYLPLGAVVRERERAKLFP